MTAWSLSEAERTIEEAKRRSVVDPTFRALALSDATAALAKINPRPIPVGAILFVEKGAGVTEIGPNVVVIELPDLGNADDELFVEDLENAAGGNSGFPPDGQRWRPE